MSHPYRTPWAPRVRPPKMLGSFVGFCMLIVLATWGLAQCAAVHSVSASGSVTASPSGDITATIGVVVTFAQAADVAAQAGVASDTQLTTQQQHDIRQALVLAGDTLRVAQEALGDYQRIGDAPSQCRLTDALQATVAARVNLLQLLSDAHVPIPPVASAAIEGIAALIQALAPQCPTTGVALTAVHARLRALR